MYDILLITSDSETVQAVKALTPPGTGRIIVQPEFSGGGQASVVLFDIAATGWTEYIKLQDSLQCPISAICTQEELESSIQRGFNVYMHSLKPLDSSLTDTLTRMLHLSPEPREDRDRNYQRYVHTEFLWNVICGVFPPNSRLLGDMAAGIGLSPERKMLPLYITVRSWTGEFTFGERAMKGNYLGSCIKNKLPQPGGLISLSPYSFVMVLYLDDNSDMTDLAAACDEISEFGERVLSCGVCCYIGTATDIAGLGEECGALMAMDRNNIVQERVLTRGGSVKRGQAKYAPDMRDWRALLDSDGFDRLLGEVFASLEQAVTEASVDREALELFSQNFSQLLSSFLQDRGIGVNDVLEAQRNNRLFAEAPASVENTLNWVYWSVSEISRFIAAQNPDDDPLAPVLHYIDAHLADRLTRETLAGLVHFSPGHLLRLFRRRLGMSITEYVKSRRLEAAARLLETTDMTVAQIAEMVGYPSYSHFYSHFAGYYGVQPAVYRAAAAKITR